MRNDAPSYSVCPNCIWDGISIDFGKMEEEMAISPLCGVLRKMGGELQRAGRIGILILAKGLCKESEEFCIWRRRDERRDFGWTVDERKKYIVWKGGELVVRTE